MTDVLEIIVADVISQQLRADPASRSKAVLIADSVRKAVLAHERCPLDAHRCWGYVDRIARAEAKRRGIVLRRFYVPPAAAPTEPAGSRANAGSS